MSPTKYGNSAMVAKALQEGLKEYQESLRVTGRVVVVVFTSLHTGQYDRILMLWSSNLGQGLLQSYNSH